MKERIRDKSAKREMKLKNVGERKGEGRTLGNIEAVGVAGAAELWLMWLVPQLGGIFCLISQVEIYCQT